MSKTRSFLVAAGGAVAMLMAPIAVLPVQDLPDGYVAHAEKGGNGKGNGGGNGNGQSSSDSGNKGNGNGNGGNSGGDAPAKKDNASNGNKPEPKAKKEAKAKNINATLGGLNSLKRNVNGLMNSADPRMAGIRAYVQDSAELVVAEEAAAAAAEALAGAEALFAPVAEAAGLVPYDGVAYPDLSYETLEARLASLNAVVLDPADPLYPALQAEIGSLTTVLATPEAVAVSAAQDTLGDAEDAVTEAQEGTTDADLTDALLAAANKNRAASYSDEDVANILAWAKDQLDETVQAYLAQ